MDIFVLRWTIAKDLIIVTQKYLALPQLNKQVFLRGKVFDAIKVAGSAKNKQSKQYEIVLSFRSACLFYLFSYKNEESFGLLGIKSVNEDLSLSD